MNNVKTIVIKRNPSDINSVEINLKSKTEAIYQLLIKLYYYDYLEFVYRCGGKVYLQQLIDYMKTIHNVKAETTRKAVREMIINDLVKSKQMHNNNLLILTHISNKFFSEQENKNILTIRLNLGSLIRTAFIAEHLIRYEATKRDFYREEASKYFITNKLKELEKMNIYIQKVSRNKQNDILLTFAIFDVSETLNTAEINNKISKINSSLKINAENVYLKINVCTQDHYKQEVLQKKYNSIYLSRLKAVEFTNLNIKRFFTSNKQKTKK